MKYCILISLVYIVLGAKLFSSNHRDVIPHMYHIVMKNNSNAASSLRLLSMVLNLRNDSSIKSASTYVDAVLPDTENEAAYLTAELRSSGAIKAALTWPNVELIEPARRIHLQCNSYNDTDWALKRISGRERAESFYYTGANGSDVNIYIVDTGIYLNHSEFHGRAVFGTCIPTSSNPIADFDGHGTHVAGLAAGFKYGASKAATLVSVRIFDDSGVGSTSDFLDGIRWVISDHLRRAVLLNPGLQLWQHRLATQPANYNRVKTVVNFSITSSGYVHSILRQVQTLKELGAIIVTAATNHGHDACWYTPANSLDTITVACTDASDNLCSFSSYGSCVDVLAPGDQIYSASRTGQNSFRFESGTSMSAPLVSGVIANVLSNMTGLYDQQYILDLLTNSSTRNRIMMPLAADGTANLLLYSTCGDDTNHSYTQLTTTLSHSATLQPSFTTILLALLISSIYALASH